MSDDGNILAVPAGGGQRRQDDDRYRSSAAGFDHHLVKPVDFEQLLTLISTARLPVLAARAVMV